MIVYILHIYVLSLGPRRALFLYMAACVSGQASQAVSSWDLPSQTTLKFRKSGQNSEAELRKRDVRAEVEESERRALDDKPATIARRYGEKTAVVSFGCVSRKRAEIIVWNCSRNSCVYRRLVISFREKLSPSLDQIWYGHKGYILGGVY